MHAYNGVLTILGLACFLHLVFCVSVKAKLTVPLLCVCVHKMTYTVSGGMLNPTHSVTHSLPPSLPLSLLLSPLPLPSHYLCTISPDKYSFLAKK